MESSSPQGVQRKSWGRADAVTLGAGVIVLLFRIGSQCLGNDEAAYALWTSGSWSELFGHLRTNNYPPLYFVLLELWTRMAGSSETALRLSTVPFAIATWLLFVPWVRRNTEPFVANVAVAAVVFSPFLLFLGRITKYFSLMSFLTVGAAMLLWQFTRRDQAERPLRERWRAIFMWGGTLLVLLWIHYLGAVVWWAAGAWLLTIAANRRQRTPLILLGILALFFVGFVPQIPHILSRTVGSEEAGMFTRIDPSSLRRVVIQMGYTAYSFAMGHTLEPTHLLLGGAGAAAGLIAFAGGVLRAWRSRCSNDTQDRFVRFILFQICIAGPAAFLVMWIALPGLPDLAVSERVGFLLPFVVIVAAYGLASLPRLLGRLMLFAYALGASVSIFNMLTLRENTQWEYLIPWREIRTIIGDDPAARVAVVTDNWHMGSRGWYYLRDAGDEHVNLRWVAEDGMLEETADRLSREFDAVYFIRNVRDTSPGNHVDEFGAKLERLLAEPCGAWPYVEDSPAMLRLKELLRRGSNTETHTHKVILLKFCRGEN